MSSTPPPTTTTTNTDTPLDAPPAPLTNGHAHDDEEKDVVPADLPRTSPTSSAHAKATSLGYAHSVSKHSTFTAADGHIVGGSTFANGAGTTGPSTTAENMDMHLRAASADTALNPEQRARISKSEAKENKKLSKIIKQEAKVEKQALDIALTELASLQKLQKAAVKREQKVQAAHSKIAAAHQKNEAAFLALRTKYEASQAQLASQTESLEVSRAGAREVTERMQEKSQEVDALRQTYAVDEREREVKLVELGGKPGGGKRWSLMG